MVVLSLKVEEVIPEVDPEAEKKDKPPKKETRLYYRFYSLKGFSKEHDFTREGKLIWEHHEKTTLSPDTGKFDEATTMKMSLAQGLREKINAIAEEEGEELKNAKDAEKPQVLYASDFTLHEMVMIVIGTDGEQHHVY